MIIEEVSTGARPRYKPKDEPIIRQTTAVNSSPPAHQSSDRPITSSYQKYIGIGILIALLLIISLLIVYFVRRKKRRRREEQELPTYRTAIGQQLTLQPVVDQLPAYSPKQAQGPTLPDYEPHEIEQPEAAHVHREIRSPDRLV
jgi:hypothetical protein